MARSPGVTTPKPDIATKRDVATYAYELLTGLGELTARHRLYSLTYMIELAKLEAADTLRVINNGGEPR